MSAGLTLLSAPLVLGLSLDTFAVSVAVGAMPLSGRERARFAAQCALAEGSMPLVGMAIGTMLAAVALPVARLAPLILMAAGVWIVREALENDREIEQVAERMRGGMAPALAAALAVSLDELAIGLAASALSLAVPVLALIIAAQALLVTLLGLRVGRFVGTQVRTRSACASGMMLIVVAVAFAVLEWR